MRLPPLIPVDEIQRRLRAAFPEGADDRGFCTREIATPGGRIAKKLV